MAEIPGGFEPSSVVAVGEIGNYQVIPEGDYQAVIVESEFKNNKKGTGIILSLKAEIVEGEYKGVTIFGDLNYTHKNPKAEQIGQGQLRSLCDAVKLFTRLNDTCEIHNKPFLLRVGYQPSTEQYKEKNTMKTFLPLNTQPPASLATQNGSGQFSQYQQAQQQNQGAGNPWNEDAMMPNNSNAYGG